MYNKLWFIPKVGGDNVERAREVCETFITHVCDSRFSKFGFKVIYDISDVDERTIVVPVGGDGTVLYAAKILAIAGKDASILGFNLGNLGFLTDLSNDWEDFNKFLMAIAEMACDEPTQFINDYRTLLDIEVEGVDPKYAKFLALNDCVVSNVFSDNIMTYQMYIGNQYAGEHKGNGVIISTPTGSTAYALNVGGSIVEPGLDVFEICPVAGMGMTSRPIIVSGQNKITIRARVRSEQSICVKADGRAIVEFDDEMVVHVTRFERKIHLLHFKDWNFFQRMTDKLNWNLRTY